MTTHRTHSNVLFTLSLALHAAAASAMFHSADASAQSAEPAQASESFVRLRLIDRATVRIFALSGMSMETERSERTGFERPLAVPACGHGTGVVVDADGFIVTAAHVVDGAQQIAIVMPGTNDAYPADVVFSDPAHDLAILRAGRTFTDVVPLPQQQPTVQLGDRVGITGYPIDPLQQMPAAASGEVSRLTNAGQLQLAAPINPGNSGGPVLDSHGALLGIVSSRLLPERGVQGIGFVEPIAPMIRAFRDNVRRSRELEGNIGARKDLAQVVALIMRAGTLGLVPDEAVVHRLVTAIERTHDVDAMVLLAAYLWNGVIAQLESARAEDVAALVDQDRARAVERVRLALGLAETAQRTDRAVARRYPIVQTLLSIAEHSRAAAEQPDPRPRAAQRTRAPLEGRFVSADRAAIVHTASDPGASTAAREPESMPRTELAFGGLLAIEPGANAVHGGGFSLSLTHDALRWDPSRSVGLSFVSLGGSIHSAFLQGDRSVHALSADLGARLRVGSASGVSVSISGHYTPALALAQASDGNLRLIPQYAAYRVNATVHFVRVFGMGLRFVDQYATDGAPSLRAIGLDFSFSF